MHPRYYHNLPAMLETLPVLDQDKATTRDLENFKADNVTLTRGIAVIGHLLNDGPEEISRRELGDIGSLLTMLAELSDVVSQATAHMESGPVYSLRAAA
ncbi:hypothetical protein [Thiorhodovibrio frisius]|uniref:Uncharacterized protein n=1 Tax=Thiorhodovibrio frisius TaxID=631362 RepID=H8YVZ1_9GAMM|nr:hypothetical protein [Thiorhodovibrio frisius]EIC23782.1 hypothetical protein Thi970DRAFT_00293 [Thiorhodovibrio frisius]WPL23209.1 hypothetical protein Thiofri_03392 [Thiorhodovibrio frisius]